MTLLTIIFVIAEYYIFYIDKHKIH